MNQTKSVVLVLVAIVIIGGGYFFSKVDKTGEMEQVTENNGKKMAFSEFLKQGGSYKCTVNQYVGDTETKGITYVSDGMIRGEYNTMVQGLDMDSFVVVRDGYSYMWSSMTPNMGFKSKVVDTKETDKSIETSGSYSFNAEQIGDYDCQEWQKDASMFELPSGVTFTELK